jgi:Helix-turn-helix domain
MRGLSREPDGTTRKIYSFVYRQGRPVRINEVQRGLGLSSSSLALYHIRKLVEEGLVREQDGGYVVDRVLFENMIRIRRSVIPFQTTYAVFFASTLIIMLTLFYSDPVTPVYIFAVMVNMIALAVSIYEGIKSLRRSY